MYGSNGLPASFDTWLTTQPEPYEEGPTCAEPSVEPDDPTCLHCPDQVIRNYDGRGTGWSHIYPDATRNGTKECRK